MRAEVAGTSRWIHRAIIEGYGTRLSVEASDADLIEQMVSDLPSGWACSPPEDMAEWRFQAYRQDGTLYTVDGAGRTVVHDDVSGARRALRLELRRCVGYHTPELTFVHAGVVAHGGRAIVLPGRSFAGKSTLVEALVRAGAEFYSDEYAILESSGRVIQYREPLILRGSDGRRETDVIADGPERPLPVGLVAFTWYRSGAAWDPTRMSIAEGIGAMIEHAIPARDRPAETLATLRRALADAAVVAGERGEADATAAALLSALSAVQR